MRKYDLALVLTPDLEEKEREKLIEKIIKEIGQLGGKLEQKDEWGKRELAYRIKRCQEGFFFLLEVSLPAEVVASLDEKIRLEEKIIRHLLVKADEGKKTLSLDRSKLERGGEKVKRSANKKLK